MKTKRMPSKVLIYSGLTFSAFFVFVPFYWMLTTSLKSSAEVDRVPPTLLPETWRWQNYVDAILQAPLVNYLWNTIVVGASVVLVSTVVTILAAFAFARLQFPGKSLLFFTVLATMMIPQEMLIITNIQTIAKLGWMNTWQALVVPFWVNPFNIFLLRQTFLQIPDELYLAAKVDGSGSFYFLRKVMLPMSWSSVITTIILSMIWIWQTYAWPNLVTTNDELRLVSNGLQNAFTNSIGSIEYELQMAAATWITVPLIVMFLSLRSYVFSGMMQGGVKG